MSLRTRTLVLVGLILLFSVAVLFVLARMILLDSFNDLENVDTRQNALRVQEALAGEFDSLGAVAGDWATWTDTYNFVRGDYDAYVEENLQDYTFVNLQVNFMIFLDHSARVVYAKQVDLDSESDTAVPPEFLALFSPDNPLLHHDAIDQSSMGMALLPDAPVFLASRPIVTSDYASEIGGTLVVGRYLDSTKLKETASKTKTLFFLLRLDGPELPSDTQAALDALPKPSAIHIKALDNDTIAGYFRLDDLHGQPALLVRVDKSRTIFHQGQKTLRYLVVSIIVTGVAFGLMSVLLLETSILRRLSTITRHVVEIGHSGDRTARLPALSGKDELAQLAGAINETLAALEKSEIERHRSNILLQEIHHRIKNSLQVVSSLLTLQTGRIQDDAAVQVLRDGQNRIQTIALVHEKLYSSTEPSLVNLGAYTESLVDNLKRSWTHSDAVTINLKTDSVILSADQAVSVGLILNELISNTFKHAFPDGRPGEINVELRDLGEKQYLIRVQDNGAGLPADLNIEQTKTLGLQLVNGLAKQLKGSLSLCRDEGTTFELRFVGE